MTIGGISSLLLLLATAVARIERPEPLSEHVDLIEVNHFYDEQGRLVFEQVIFYDWSGKDCRFQVVDWRLLKHPSQIPLRDWTRGGYSAVWHDFKMRDVLRLTTCDFTRESWTQYDPELVEREHLPQEKRRELCKVRKPDPTPKPVVVGGRDGRR